MNHEFDRCQQRRVLAVLFAGFTSACSGAPFTGSLESDAIPASPTVAPRETSGVTSTVEGSVESGTTASPDAGGAGAEGASSSLELELIDGAEGPFPSICESNGRNGYWFVAADGSGGWLSSLEAFALEQASADNQRAARVAGSGFTAWGALLGVTFRDPFAAYDASAYCGVRFVAKGSGQGWRLSISDRSSEPDGGICVGLECYDHLSQDFQPGHDWQRYEVHFSDLMPALSDGQPARALDSDALYAIDFVFENVGGAPFELLVDDLSFIPLGGCSELQP
jgi:hypothetical protein